MKPKSKVAQVISLYNLLVVLPAAKPKNFRFLSHAFFN